MFPFLLDYESTRTNTEASTCLRHVHYRYTNKCLTRNSPLLALQPRSYNTTATITAYCCETRSELVIMIGLCCYDIASLILFCITLPSVALSTVRPCHERLRHIIIERVLSG
jgi:hypothetical protein